jgi:phosphohistidine swiveling domain-containing protein
MSYIVRSDDGVAAGDATALFGGKGRALASLTATGMPVPRWFAISTDAWRASLTPEQRAAASHVPPTDDDMTSLRAVRPREDVVAAIDDAVRSLATSSGDVFAVRSSAADEDAAQQSFAGQLESYLFVRADHVADRVARVWASAFTERVAAYRRNRGISPVPVPPVVLVQRMIDADVSGVAFSADPVSGARDIAVVSAVFGLGTALVSGEADADTFKVDRDGRIVDRIIADKRTAHRRSATSVEGVEPVEVAADRAKQPALDDPAIREVAQLARTAEQHFGAPQDIEWAYRGGRLSLLQARPITSLAATPARSGDVTIWDNSNIAESYGGMTTPLTFTFAQHAYDSAYRQFFRLLSIPDGVAAAHDETFRNMLGLIRGRIYYNLLNWYRLLALLPGFRINRPFMEQMMGVKEALPESVLADLRGAQAGSRVADALAVARTSAALAWHHLTLRARMRRFYRVFDDALASDPERLATLGPEEIVREYRRLEQRLVNDWDAPLINDFFAMIFYGLLRRACSTWCGDSAGTLQNDLLCGQGGMISTRPAAAIRELAAVAAADPRLVDALARAPTSEALAALRRDPHASVLFERYMREFGDRCDGELKLESPTLRDDPSMLLRAVGRLASQTSPVNADAVAQQPSLRAAAEQRVAEALARAPLRRAMFAWILRNARGRIVDRENLRFARTRLFGRIRAIFIALGGRFAERGLLEEPRDIFYLELAEALGAVENPAAGVDLKARVAARKAEFERYRHMPAPPDRFVTHGPIGGGADVSIDGGGVAIPDGTAPRAAGETRTGTGCCPGVVRGTVRVVRDPHTATLRPGDVLVAERTDPSWVMLFPAASGILVERGSLLSHAAIVAREMGIPAIVSIEGLTSWLKDGDQVEFDGASGVLTRIQPAAELAHAQ